MDLHNSTTSHLGTALRQRREDKGFELLVWTLEPIKLPCLDFDQLGKLCWWPYKPCWIGSKKLYSFLKPKDKRHEEFRRKDIFLGQTNTLSNLCLLCKNNSQMIEVIFAEPLLPKQRPLVYWGGGAGVLVVLPLPKDVWVVLVLLVHNSSPTPPWHTHHCNILSFIKNHQTSPKFLLAPIMYTATLLHYVYVYLHLTPQLPS